jgi:hypothetical protein
VYADTCKLFYDRYGGDRVGGVWDPSLREEREFKVLAGYSTIPIDPSNVRKYRPYSVAHVDLTRRMQMTAKRGKIRKSRR